MLECVINVSEGRDRSVIRRIAKAGGICLLDVHSDAHHNRSVLTLAGGGVEGAARDVTTEALRWIDLRVHAGVHPRLGAVDVVPFVPLDGSSMDHALAARQRYAAWAGGELGIPCFLYGPERSLPDVRRQAFAGLAPDTGPAVAHPSAGAICVGARPVLVAYNVWLAAGVAAAVARQVARDIRGPGLRALGLDVGGRAQVSMNLLDPLRVTPADAYDAVAARAPVERAELVGLLPQAVLDAIPPERWSALDLDGDRLLPPAPGPGRPLTG